MQCEAGLSPFWRPARGGNRPTRFANTRLEMDAHNVRVLAILAIRLTGPRHKFRERQSRTRPSHGGRSDRAGS